MKLFWAHFFLLAGSLVAVAQTQVPAAPSCSKNVSFAIADEGQPVPATPKFAVKWLAGKEVPRNYPSLCFSQIPSPTLINYLVIFSTSEAAFEGLSPTAHTYTSSKPMPGNGTVVSSSGGTWNYSYVTNPPAKVTSTTDLQHFDKSKSLFARVYNQQGFAIGRYTPQAISSREKMLQQALSDIRGVEAVAPSQKAFAAPMSVYYVNCDVDGSPTQSASTELPRDQQTQVTQAAQHAESQPPQAATTPRPPPPPEAVFDFWSNPPGADIYLDGIYVGKTPLSRSVSVGAHAVLIRKKDFSSWQRELRATPGQQHVSAYLEQKSLTID